MINLILVKNYVIKMILIGHLGDYAQHPSALPITLLLPILRDFDDLKHESVRKNNTGTFIKNVETFII